MIHCFKVTGTVLFRTSGNDGFPPVECVVIETTAYVVNEDGDVFFTELQTGHTTWQVSAWFDDWNNRSDNGSRLVEIAVPRWAYDQILRTGRSSGPTEGFSLEQIAHCRQINRALSSGRHEFVQAPIAAVMVNGQWIFTRPAATEVPMRRV